MNEFIIKSEKIIKSYNTVNKVSITVLKSISIRVPKNRITVIFGASGAGKSTLLHILSGLDRPDSGSVEIEGTDIFSLSDEKMARFRNENMGFVFQFHHLLPEFTALENVIIPQIVFKNNIKKAKEKSIRLLNEMGLEERIHHKPAELSGGEQQRIALARALANDPEIIFADEPTGNLDTSNSNLIHNIFLKLRDDYKKTLVIVTHNQELMKLADYLVEMKDGNIISENYPSGTN